MAALMTSCAARPCTLAAARPTQQRVSAARVVGGAGGGAVPNGLGASSVLGLGLGLNTRRRGGAGCAALSRSEEVVSMSAAAAAGGGAAAEERAWDVATSVEGAAEEDEHSSLDLSLAKTALLAAGAFAFLAVTAAEPATAAQLSDHADAALGMSAAAPHELWSVAGSEVPFWANMVKYARFSISIMVGFAFMFGRPVVELLKKPQTAFLVVVGGYGSVQFFKFTIETMLGLNDAATLNY
eukprot:CAMPEP_0197576706 /NCGR_PEP_ID=MMETSP1326-20131121/1626_1 /TAXON_ID=1155430 /ORGANISM="Genus nov. species nov., Strain RCC2288" /LENGTH=239 /DNA_ID=CAMNT_0043139667 /DNA_START=73 /DNA_END=792 /DNA_ORIENTATION=+